MSFKKISEKKTIKNIVIQEFEHEKTGARHTHFVVEGGENAFNISFKTPVSDKRGLPHIIEHLILNGSKNFPVDNMFLKLSGRNFETMLNASTYSNYTTFYYASNVEEGYLNLSEIFLDAVLNPLLTEKSFLTEAFRYELDEEKNLKFSGVVYNEMMGWVGKVMPEQLMRTALGNHSSNEYAGGDPISIADVKHQDVIDFHNKYYNPSNSHVVTTGDIAVEKIHTKLEKYFEKFEKTQRVIIEPFEINNRKDYYEINHTGNDVISSYVYSPIGEFDEKLFKKLNTVNSLIAHDLNIYFNENHTGLDFQGSQFTRKANQMFFLSAFNLQSEEQNKTLSEYWKKALQEIVNGSIPKERIETLFNNELANIKSELKSSYANKINTSAVSIINEGFDPDILLISEKETLEKKEYFEQPRVIQNLVEKHLLNSQVIVLSSIPDPDLIEKYNKNIKQKENEINSLFTEEEKIMIANRINILPAENGTSENLPKVHIDKRFKAKSISREGIVRDVKTINGAKVIISSLENESEDASVLLKYRFLPRNEEELCFEIISQHLLHNTDNKEMDKKQTNIWRTSNVKGLTIGILERYNKESENTSLFSIASIAGQKVNILEMLDKTLKLTTIQDIKNPNELRINLEKSIDGFESNSGDLLYQYAIQYSTKEMRNNIFGYYDEIKVLRKIKEMIESLKSGDTYYFDKFHEYYNSDIRKNNKVFEANIQCDPKDAKNIIEKLKNANVLGENIPFSTKDLNEFITIDEVKENTLLIADTSSGFVSLSYENPYVNNSIKEQAELGLTSALLKNILNDKLRVDQGVYSSFVIKNPDTVSLFAYRTPNSLETLETMKNIFQEIVENGIDDNMFESVKRQELTEFTAFKSKSEILTLINRDRAFSLEEERSIKLDAILNFEKEDVINMIQKVFLNNNNYTIAIADNSSLLEGEKVDLTNFEVVMFPSQEIVKNKLSKRNKL